MEEKFTLSVPKAYRIDASKIKTLEDVIKVIEYMNIVVTDNYENFEKMKPFLSELK